MESINYSTARKTLAGLMEDVCRDCNPVIITKNRGCAVVMISLQDFNSIMETEHLLRSPANAARLFSAIQSDKKQCGKKITLEQLEAAANEKPAVHPLKHGKILNTGRSTIRTRSNASWR